MLILAFGIVGNCMTARIMTAVFDERLDAV